MHSERKTRLIRVAAVIGIALGAGHIAQSTPRNASYASVMPQVEPETVVPLSATVETKINWSQPSLADTALPVLPKAAARPEVTGPVRLDTPEPVADLDCTPVLTLVPGKGAMIDVGLSAPCRPSQRVVLRHAGLAVTYKTNAVGALTASLPALAEDARVSVLFPGGDSVEAAVSLPEAAQLHRFGVQWMGPAAFGVNAFENGADYGTPGHVSAADAGRPEGTDSLTHGFLTLLGDSAVENPMLAEIYTYPAGQDRVPVVVEAAVTEDSCGQEMLGETLNATAGEVVLSDLSVTMPGCDAAGDYLLLKNLVPDMTLASAN